MPFVPAVSGLPLMSVCTMRSGGIEHGAEAEREYHADGEQQGEDKDCFHMIDMHPLSHIPMSP